MRALRRALAALGLAGLLLAAAAPAALAAERILFFDSQVTIQPDASLLVIETIQVRAEGRQIKRGIVREFPTTYRDRAGRKVTVGFELRRVLRDGRSEPHHLKRVSNGVHIYIGQKDKFLSPGVYTYQITYWTNHQVGFFADYDELYWNVTGNGWRLPIDQAQAEVELPPGAHVLQHAAYTGRSGARGKDFTFGTDPRGRIRWATSKPLRIREGLTIAVAWPKGLVTPPTPTQELLRSLMQSRSALAGLAGLVVLLLYYLLAWLRVGRDPRAGTIIPLFEPPSGLSPAGARFISRMGFDHKAFAAAVVNMAVKGYLIIEEEPEKEFTLRRTGKGPEDLFAGEKRLASALFKGGSSIKLEKAKHTRISKAINALNKRLQGEYEKANFNTNWVYLLPGLAISLAALVAMVLAAPDPGNAAGMTFWLAIWCGVCFMLSARVLRAWRAVRSLGGGLAALGATLFALPFLGGAVFGLYTLGEFTDPFSVPLLLLILGLTPLFGYLLKAPTVGGRRLLDQIEGFKLYLSVAEKERLGMLHPPEKTPQLFERYLPYALALEVENQWAEQFAQVLDEAGQEPYQPSWYAGRTFDTSDPAGFSQGLAGSFAGAIASSSTAPGSSSGSGGGGSSGGGGGGGGGGGW